MAGQADLSQPRRDHVRLVILECDIPLEQTRVKHGSYGAIFEKLLNDSCPRLGITRDALRVRRLDVREDDCIFPDLKDLDAILITGSRHDAWSNAPWIQRLVAYVQKVIAVGSLRVIGVCFGHQIVGRALGSLVGRAPVWEAGVTDVSLTPVGQKIFGKDLLRIHEMHRDVVFDCPADGVHIIGVTESCAIQGLYAPAKVLTLQGHPEADVDLMGEVVDARLENGAFNKTQWAQVRAKIAKPHDGDLVHMAFLDFLF